MIGYFVVFSGDFDFLYAIILDSLRHVSCNGAVLCPFRLFLINVIKVEHIFSLVMIIEYIL